MKKKTNEELENLRKELDETKNKYLRSLADYQNLEKQTETWRNDFVRFANSALISKILEVADDLEKAQEHLNDEGLKIILDKLNGVLKNNGLEEIKAEGEQFNPEEMEAVQVEPGEENHKVTKTLQKGYRLNGRVVRPAKVVVSKSS